FDSIKVLLSAERRLDMMSRCYHFWYAYYKCALVVESISRVLITLATVDEQCKAYPKASFYIKELKKRYASLPNMDVRVRCLDEVEAAYTLK
ncbi:hypothetical protein Tcan_02348, partial [Toxocara canis]